MAIVRFKRFGELTVLYAEHASLVQRFVHSFRADVDAFMHAVRDDLEQTLGRAIGEQVANDGATEWAVVPPGAGRDGSRVFIRIDRHSPEIVWPGELRLDLRCAPAGMSPGDLADDRRRGAGNGAAAPVTQELVIRLDQNDPVGSAVDVIAELVRRLQKAMDSCHAPCPLPAS